MLGEDGLPAGGHSGAIADYPERNIITPVTGIQISKTSVGPSHCRGNLQPRYGINRRASILRASAHRAWSVWMTAFAPIVPSPVPVGCCSIIDPAVRSHVAHQSQFFVGGRSDDDARALSLGELKGEKADLPGAQDQHG